VRVCDNWIIAPRYSYQASGNDYQLQNEQYKELETCPKSWIALLYTGEDAQRSDLHEIFHTGDIANPLHYSLIRIYSSSYYLPQNLAVMQTL